MHQHVDAPPRLGNLANQLVHRVSVGHIAGTIVRGAAGTLDLAHCREQRRGALEGGDLAVDHDRRGACTGIRDPLGDVALEVLTLVPLEAPQVGIAGIRSGGDVGQVEGATAGTCQVGDDGRRDPTSRAGDQEHALWVQLERRLGTRYRPFFQRDRIALPITVADLDGARIAQRLLDQDLGDGPVIGVDGKVERLDQRLRALARVGLGKAGHGAAQRRGRALVAIAVQAAEARGGDQEGLLGKRAHQRVEGLDPHLVPGAPRGEVHLAQRWLDVERRQKVDAVDRPFGQPLV